MRARFYRGCDRCDSLDLLVVLFLKALLYASDLRGSLAPAACPRSVKYLMSSRKFRLRTRSSVLVAGDPVAPTRESTLHGCTSGRERHAHASRA